MNDDWKHVNRVIKESDLLLIVIDARFIKESINHTLLRKVRKSEKDAIIIAAKTDLAKKLDKTPSMYGFPFITVSSKSYDGMRKLKKLIKEFKRELDQRTVIGILGYPNVGKSSLINALTGKKSARTSNVAGFTRGKQLIKLGSNLYLLDSPGVIPRTELRMFKHSLTGAIDFNTVKNPDLKLMSYMKRNPGKVESYFSVPIASELDESLEHLAIKKRFLKKGGESDTDRLSRMVLKLIQEGKIN